MDSEFQDIPIGKLHDWSANPRQHPSEDGLEELTASVLRHGVLQPVLVRPLPGKAAGSGAYLVIAGARRVAAARKAGLALVPARILAIDENAAEEVAIIENLQREEMAPLDEGLSYARLLETGRTIDDIAAAVGKSKPYIYQRLTLTRLEPTVANLLVRDVLPLAYALKLALLAPELQARAAEQCFRPLFYEKDTLPTREALEPMAVLQAWIDKHAKLEPRSEATAVLLPELAAQVEAVESEAEGKPAGSVLALSSLHFHTDKSEPKPILAASWKRAEGKSSCGHAQAGVIVLGDGRGTLLQVCVAKKACRKHWPVAKKPAAAKSTRSLDRARHEEQWKKDAAIAEEWRKVRRPAALRVAAQELAGLEWSPVLFRLVCEDIGGRGDIEAITGKFDTLAPSEYPRVLALLLLSRNAYEEAHAKTFAKRIGLTLSAKAIDAAIPSAPKAKAS